MFKLIVGIGNYGQQYQNTRHNAGFLIADAFAKRLNQTFSKYRFESKFFSFISGITKFIVIKPQTLVNLSGISVTAWKQFYNIKTEHIIVIHDELDIPLGQFKIKLGGSASGHNGIASIIRDIGSRNFYHIKIGIGHPTKPQLGGKNYVLGHFSPSEQKVLEKVIGQVCEALNYAFVENNSLSKTMSVFNDRTKRTPND